MKEKHPEINNESLMSMSPWNFDQSSDGWRKFEAKKEFLVAAKLIEDYIERNKENILNQPKDQPRVSLEIMYFHVGQELAAAGKDYYLKSIEQFNNSFMENRECWNAYVLATIGFLENEIKKIDEAINLIENSKEEEKGDGNISIVRNFKKSLESGEKDYMRAYLMPRK